MRFFTSCSLMFLISHQVNAGWLFGSSETAAAEPVASPTQVVISQPVFGNLDLHNHKFVAVPEGAIHLHPNADFGEAVPLEVVPSPTGEEPQVEPTPVQSEGTKGGAADTPAKKGFWARWWRAEPKKDVVATPIPAETAAAPPGSIAESLNVGDAETMGNTPVVEIVPDPKKPGYGWFLWYPSFFKKADNGVPPKVAKPQKHGRFPFPPNWHFLPFKPEPASVETPGNCKCIYPVPPHPGTPVIVTPDVIERPVFPSGYVPYKQDVNSGDASIQHNSAEVVSEGNVRPVAPSGDSNNFESTRTVELVPSETVAAPVIVPAPEPTAPNPAPVQPPAPSEPTASTFASNTPKQAQPAKTFSGSTAAQEVKDKSFSISKTKFAPAVVPKVVKKP